MHAYIVQLPLLCSIVNLVAIRGVFVVDGLVIIIIIIIIIII